MPYHKLMGFFPFFFLPEKCKIYLSYNSRRGLVEQTHWKIPGFCFDVKQLSYNFVCNVLNKMQFSHNFKYAFLQTWSQSLVPEGNWGHTVCPRLLLGRKDDPSEPSRGPTQTEICSLMKAPTPAMRCSLFSGSGGGVLVTAGLTRALCITKNRWQRDIGRHICTAPSSALSLFRSRSWAHWQAAVSDEPLDGGIRSFLLFNFLLMSFTRCL